MGFKDLFTKKNSTSDCCGVEIVADDDTDTDTTETTSDLEEQHTQATSYPDTSRSLPACLAPGRGADSRCRHQRPRAEFARGRWWCQVGWSVLEQLGNEPAYPGVDVVTDQTHALDPLDATLGRLVSHPPLARTAGTVG